MKIYNLGTGSGFSVLEMIRAFEKACGKELPYRVVERRPGDIGACYADPSKGRELGWKAERESTKCALRTEMAERIRRVTEAE